MNAGRSRLALIGVLALAVCVAVSLAAGSAEAKKKKKKGGNSVTVSQTTPTAIPAGIAPSATSAGKLGFASVSLTVGKKAKGKVVGWDSATLTTTFTGGTPDALQSVFMELTAPNGRTVGTDFESTLINPIGDGTNTTSGPLTETPDSPFKVCVADPGPPPIPPCPNPEATVGPPYAGTVGSNGLTLLNGVPARGTWTLKLFNASSATTATLNSVSLSLTLKSNPA